MKKIKIDDPLLQLQHYEEPQAVTTDKQHNWIPAFKEITDYLEPGKFSFTRSTKTHRH